MGGRTAYKTRAKHAAGDWEARVGPALYRRLAGPASDWLDATYRSNVCQGQNCEPNASIARNMGFASLGFIPDEGGTPEQAFGIWSDIILMKKYHKRLRIPLLDTNTGYKFGTISLPSMRAGRMIFTIKNISVR